MFFTFIYKGNMISNKLDKINNVDLYYKDKYIFINFDNDDNCEYRFEDDKEFKDACKVWYTILGFKVKENE